MSVLYESCVLVGEEPVEAGRIAAHVLDQVSAHPRMLGAAGVSAESFAERTGKTVAVTAGGSEAEPGWPQSAGNHIILVPPLTGCRGVLRP